MKLLSQRPRTLVGFSILIFILIVGVDQAVKSWALKLDEPIELGWARIAAYGNSGVFGGFLSELDPWIVRIFFSVLFGFLCISGFLLIHLLKHKRTPLLKWGIMVYLSGLLGNVWDRMTTGKVTDYLVFNVIGLKDMAFNFADFAVITGFVLIGVAIFREQEAIWYAKDKRRGYWIDTPFQRTFGLLLTIAGFAHFFIIALYSFVYLKVFIGSDIPLADLDADKVVHGYLGGLFILELGAIFLTFGVSILFSQRLVGPLIALEQYVARLASKEQDPSVPIRLRQGDYLQNRVMGIAARAAQALRPDRLPDPQDPPSQ